MSDVPAVGLCNCQALRRAARHISQFYDQQLAPFGLTVSQYSLIACLARLGPRSINDLARELVLDRTTLGRNLRLLERDGLARMAVDARDRRSRTVEATDTGRQLILQARPAWEEAQHRFELAFGSEQAATLRVLLQAVVETPLSPE